jgi:hypothetical protein
MMTDRSSHSSRGFGGRSIDAASESSDTITVYPTADPNKPIFLAPGAYSRICGEALASADGLETAGFLFADRSRDPTRIHSASGPGPDAVREAGHCETDGDYLSQLMKERRSFGDSDTLDVGLWHSHLGNDIRPSPTDLRTWEEGFEYVEERIGERAAYSAIIVTQGNWPTSRCHSCTAGV